MSDTTDPSETGLLVRGLKSALAGPFDFAVKAGGCAVISGPSGSGKSLFLRMIADLDPNEGEVRLNGIDRQSLDGPSWRQKAPYVPAEAGWWLDQVADHFAPRLHDAARRLATDFGLVDGQFDGAVARLSTGERQRLAVQVELQDDRQQGVEGHQGGGDGDVGGRKDDRVHGALVSLRSIMR